MHDQLPEQPHCVETGIINLDSNSGPGTHWFAYIIDPHGIVYFDLYGLPPPREVLIYINQLLYRVGYSTLPTQSLTDPPICGHESIAVLDAISRSTKPSYKVVFDYTSKRHDLKQ